MIRRPPRSTRTVTLFPYTTLFRSGPQRFEAVLHADVGERPTGEAGLRVAPEEVHVGVLDRAPDAGRVVGRVVAVLLRHRAARGRVDAIEEGVVPALADRVELGAGQQAVPVHRGLLGRRPLPIGVLVVVQIGRAHV